jgi:dTDP-4-amino-4,6-dideoxygalactose transaminase
VGLPAEHGRGAHVYHQFTVRSGKRDALRDQLAARGIASAIYYPIPGHRQPAFSEGAARDLPASDCAAREVLSLPIYPQLTEAQIRHVCEAVRAAG